MSRTIVLALDGSEGSREAVPLAVELARGDNAKLVVVHVEEEVIGPAQRPVHTARRPVLAVPSRS